jgi:hypothetical protein
MPGLAATDERRFVAAFSAIDRRSSNPWFLGGSFFGPVVFGELAAVLGLGRPGLGVIVTAVGL